MKLAKFISKTLFIFYVQTRNYIITFSMNWRVNTKQKYNLFLLQEENHFFLEMKLKYFLGLINTKCHN